MIRFPSPPAVQEGCHLSALSPALTALDVLRWPCWVLWGNVTGLSTCVSLVMSDADSWAAWAFGHVYAFFGEMCIYIIAPFLLGCWFWYRAAQAICMFWRWIVCGYLCLQISFFHSESDLFLWFGFLCCAQALQINYIPFVCFCLVFHYPKRWEKRTCSDLR